MNRPNNWQAVAGVLVIAFAATGPGAAQERVRELPTVKVKGPKPKTANFQGEVLNWTPVSVTVRDTRDTALVRTFRFSPELERKLEGRHVENGRKITVRYLAGSETAVKINGKIQKYK